MRGKERFGAIAVCAALQAAAAPGAALPSLHVEIPFEGRIRQGQTVPLLVSIEHPGPNLDCLLSASSATGALVSKRRINLPPGSKKRLFLYFEPSRYGSRFEVTLSAGRIPLAKQEVSARPLANDRPLCAIVENRDLGLHRLIRAALPEAAVVSVSKGSLPDRWYGYEAIDLLLWPLASGDPPSTDVEDAMRGYVEAGGTLLITLGGDPARLGPLRRWLPEGIGPGEEKQTGRVVNNLSSGEGFRRLFPLDQVQVLEKRIGLGRLLVAGFDPAVGKEQLALLLAARLGSGEIDSPRQGGTGKAGGKTRGRTSPSNLDTIYHKYASKFVEAIPGLRPIPLRFLAAFMALYLLVVGPVDYFVLKRLRRLTWTWITYPLAILVFSTIAYGYAVAVKGTRMVVSSFEIRDSNALDPFLIRRFSLTGVFSVSDRIYSLDSPTHSALLRIGTTRRDRGGTAGLDRKGDLLQDPSRMVVEVPIKVFSMEKVASLGMFRETKLDLVVEDLGAWEELAPTVKVRPIGFRNIRVRNAGKESLLGVTVVGPKFSYVQIGDLRPGETKSVASFGRPKNASKAPKFPSTMSLGIKRAGERIVAWDRSLFSTLNMATCRAKGKTGFRRDIAEGGHLVLAYRLTHRPGDLRIDGAKKAGDRLVVLRVVVPPGGSS